MNIGIVILNFNGKNDTLECVRSILRLKNKGLEVTTVIVDNASTDGSVVFFKEKIPQITILVNAENLGFSAGNNMGIRYLLKTPVEFILILNNDTYLHQDALSTLYKEAKKLPKGGIFGPKIYFAPRHEFHKKRYTDRQRGKVIWYCGGVIDWANMLASHRGVDEVDTGQYNTISKTAFVSGCAMFIKRAVFERVGMFDPKLFLYYEDLDLSKRAQQKGFESYYIPTSMIWHKNAQSAEGVGSKTQEYYQTRNRLLIGFRYAPWRTKLALFREATRLLMTGTPIKRQAVGDFLRKRYGKRT